ncbi:DUF2243 domain-containing protein [Paenimyroides ummariense]|uniref:DUF2243 domain-containing protein n=1 Tax=Paenimyroides ummariense TaxID=913024 RepID=UPI0037C54AF9
MGQIFCRMVFFNFVEGLLHHHILEFHNVHELSQQQVLWNYGFLLSGPLFMVIGFYIIYHRNYYPKRLEQLGISCA